MMSGGFGTIVYNIEMTYIQARGHAPVEVGILLQLELQEQLEVQLELEARIPLEVDALVECLTQAPRS